MNNCPKCGNSKFFSDQYHQNAFSESYAMCKFCGYWKKEGEEPRQCNMFYHECRLPNQRMGYDWNENDTCACQTCGQTLTNKVKWPVDNPNHPFHKL